MTRTYLHIQAERLCLWTKKTGQRLNVWSWSCNSSISRDRCNMSRCVCTGVGLSSRWWKPSRTIVLSNWWLQIIPIITVTTAGDSNITKYTVTVSCADVHEFNSNLEKTIIYLPKNSGYDLNKVIYIIWKNSHKSSKCSSSKEIWYSTANKWQNCLSYSLRHNKNSHKFSSWIMRTDRWTDRHSQPCTHWFHALCAKNTQVKCY
jgi:hypothetical protein